VIHLTVFSGKNAISTQLWVSKVVAHGEYLEQYFTSNDGIDHYLGRVHFKTFQFGPAYKVEIGRP
jgi:hypothetical protein